MQLKIPAARSTMKLNAFTDYSLRVLIYLAADPGRRATIAQICAAFDVKANHLTKVVHHLGKCGWVETVRGKGGGLTLAMPAEAINVGQVVRDAEGAALPAECFDPAGSTCAIQGCCRLRSALAEAVQAFYGVLDRLTLADICQNPRQLVAILHLPRRTAAQAA